MFDIASETNAIKSIDYAVSEDYAKTTWDSCRGVKNPQTQESIMQVSFDDVFSILMIERM